MFRVAFRSKDEEILKRGFYSRRGALVMRAEIKPLEPDPD
jgi:hypothetical protein